MFRLRQFGGLTLVGPDGVLGGAAAHRRSLALLAVVAAGREHGVSRAKLTGLFWPDSDEERARGALAQTIYRVRQELGADVLVGTDQLRLNPAVISAEATEFEEALERRELERAVALYAGPFLDGFYLPRVPQFERWTEDERSRLAHRHRDALMQLGERATARGAHAEAATWWRMLAAVDPLSAAAATQLVQALTAAGDVSGALRAARVHETLVRAELGTEPDASFASAVASIQAATMAAQAPLEQSGPAASAPSQAPGAAPPAPPSPVAAMAPSARAAVAEPGHGPAAATRRERPRVLSRRALGWMALGGTMAVVVALALMVATRRTSVSGAAVRAPGGPLRPASVATRSPVARRMYEEGLRAFNHGESAVAARLFAAALQEDTTFAMAAYYAYRSTAPMQDRSLPYLERARRLAQRTTERERLIVEATWADLTDEPRRLAIAESLTVRAPGEPMGHVLLGNALLWQGNFPGALVAYRQAVILDSAGLRDGVAQCAACDGMEGMIGAHLYADSLAGATRLAREWTARQPSSGRAWYALASTLALQADTSGATNALRRSLALENAPDWQFFAAALAIRAGDFRQADRLLDGLRQAGTDAMRREALWWLIIGRRYEGRFRDALDSVRELRALAPDDQNVRLLQAQVLVELGRPREAAELLDTLVRAVRAAPAASEAKRARNLAWTLTHRATALAAAGDSTPLAGIAEEVRTAGERSGYGRDRRLHHYVRGLLLTARQRPNEAVAELRQAIFSPAAGYTRVNVALAKLHLARGEPREAIPLLRAALHGSLEASNLYVTHTELHALLARAFAATAEPDSAAAHSRYVQRTLIRTDPSVRFSSELQR